MRPENVAKMTASTADAAFAVDADGVIVAWNRAAEVFFALPASVALGRRCAKVVQGRDECGAVCTENCRVRQALQKRTPIGNFDLLAVTSRGRVWCNVSILAADSGVATHPYALHILRAVDSQKRLEILTRAFVLGNALMAGEPAGGRIPSAGSAARGPDLTRRELEILRLLATGGTTASVADELSISPTTVNNHVQHILRKLDAHTRLEAIRRAEHAGLV
jgi:DNA-binding CsgD family transcriptional regulator